MRITFIEPQPVSLRWYVSSSGSIEQDVLVNRGRAAAKAVGLRRLAPTALKMSPLPGLKSMHVSLSSE